MEEDFIRDLFVRGKTGSAERSCGGRNALFGIAIGDLSGVDPFGGGTSRGNSVQDIRCWGQYSVAWHLEKATCGTSECPMP